MLSALLAQVDMFRLIVNDSAHWHKLIEPKLAIIVRIHNTSNWINLNKSLQ